MIIANAKPVQLTLDGQVGVVFENETREVLVFVPQECVVIGNDGEMSIDQASYFSSGWAQRSVQFSDSRTDLELAFPDASRPIFDKNEPRLKALLLRLRHAYVTSLSSY